MNSEQYAKQHTRIRIPCHAATADHVGSVKRSTKSEKRRHAMICAQARQMIVSGVFTARPSDAEEVIRRLANSEAECAK